MKNGTYEAACTNSNPDDEHEMFETCRRHQELNLIVNGKNSVYFVG